MRVTGFAFKRYEGIWVAMRHGVMALGDLAKACMVRGV